LNRHFEGHARVLGTPTRIVLTDVGPYPLPEALAPLVQQLRPAVNEGHGILAEGPAWTGTEASVRYHHADYRIVQALRASGRQPLILSATAMLIDPARRHVVLNRRSSSSTHYPDRLHCFGGTFVPPLPIPQPSSDRSLEDTMLREVREETLQPAKPGTWPTLLLEENGFFQASHLGVELEGPVVQETDEGAAVNVPFDSLGDTLLVAKDWVPSGKLAVLAWLALGAPGAPGATFAGRSPAELFAWALESSARDYPGP
jgi:hypothetical protein